jgi:formylglycine-generating enzyme required for sulfatase activity
MVQVYVPAGNFLMGSTEQELEALGFDPDDFRDEFPQHEVYLDAYWIDQTEVTNAMFAAFLNERGNQVENGNTWLQADSEALRIHQQGGVWVTDPGYENHPVLGVRWYGAQAYCEWAGRRLPTEAEWEKAARGTEGQIYPWGNGSPSCNLANYRGCTGETAEVGSYPGGMSPSGALDMAGNVVEWVSDRYGETYYSSSPTNNPQGPTSGYMRVMRGGSWNLHPEAARVARRYWGATAYPDNNKTGVRCAEDASGTDTPAPTRDPQSMSPPDPPQPLTPPPLSFTFSPTTGPAGSQVELYLNTAMLDINVYYDGQLIPKSVSPDGRTLTVRIPGTAVGSSYFDLCWDGGCVAATEPFIVTPTNANLLLSNKSGQTICFLYISPSDQTTWGNDWLGGETMPSPSFDVFTVPQSGFYDFKVEDCTHNLIDHRYGRFLGSYYWEILP